MLNSLPWKDTAAENTPLQGAGTLNRCNMLLIVFIGDFFSIKFSIPFCFFCVFFFLRSVPIYKNSIAF